MELINTSTAAEIIGITRQGVIAAINRGSLKACKMGGDRRGIWVIERTEAERYRDEHSKQGGEKEREQDDIQSTQ
jgi:hypothetical protein